MTSQTLLIAEREIRERRFVFIAAAVAAVLPYVAFILPGPQKISRSEVGAVGVGISLIFAMALALIVGASLVGRELSERRLSFYFTKPLPASSIWFGKLLAGIVLVVTSFTIIAVPSVITADPQLRRFGETDWRLVAGWFGLLVAQLLFGHTTSTMVRSRSPRVAIDLALLAVACTLAWLIIRELLASVAFKAAGITGVIIAVGLVASAVAGGAWQLSRGRSDARRSHAALSQFLWPAIAVVLLIAGGYVAWLFSAKPSDLVNPDMAQAAPQWIYMTGQAHLRSDYRPFFLINATNSEVMRLGAIPGGAVVSRDGHTFTFVRSTSLNKRGGPFELQVLRVDQRPYRVVGTSIESAPFDSSVLSDDGRLFAHIRHGLVSVHDLKAKRLMASARLPQFNPSRRYQMAFLSPALLRIYELPRGASVNSEATAIRAFELEIARRAIALTGEFRRDSRGLFLSGNEDASRLVIQPWGERNERTLASLVDGRTLQPITELDAALRPFRSVWFLSDGRIAAAEGSGEDTRRLAILAPDGHRLSTTEIAGPGGFFLMGEAAPGHLVIGATQKTGDEFDHATLVVDAGSGRILRREEHVMPVWQENGPWGPDPRQPRFDAQRVWLVREKGTVWRWNPLTGEKTILVRTRTDSEKGPRS